MITVIGNRTLCRSVIILVIKQLGLPLRGRPILFITRMISIGNSMISSDIWHKYHTWYFEIVTRPVYVVSRAEWNLRQFRNITSGLYAKYHVQLMLFKFVYTTTRKRLAISTCRYSKLSWNTTSLSQWNCRNFSWSSISDRIGLHSVLLPLLTGEISYNYNSEGKHFISSVYQAFSCAVSG